MSDLLKSILTMLVPMVLSAIREVLSNDKFVIFADKVFDMAERWIEKEPDSYDPWLLELVQIFRDALNVPDLPDA